MSSELVKQDTAIQEVPDTSETAALLKVIASAATDPRVDIEKMERLLAMQERLMESQRRQAYAAAMSRLQARLPQIDKTGRIMAKDKGGNLVERSRYAPLEDIDVIIRPLLEEEGFSSSFNEETATKEAKRFSLRILHREGHSETWYLTVPIDSSDFRTPIQSMGSTTSYARRYLIKMALNIVEKNEDNDGNDQKTIDENQAKDIDLLLLDTKSDRKRFLDLIAGVDKVEDIPARDYRRIMNALETKLREQKAKQQ